MLTGSVVIGSEFLLSGCKNSESSNNRIFSNKDIAFLDEVAETILPATTSPGAKEAAVGAFIGVMVNDCYTEKDQQIFHEGLKTLEIACKKEFNKGFLQANSEQRTKLLIGLDKEAKEYQKTKKKDDPTHYFTMIKQLTLFGFFTSKPGSTQALRHISVPGKYDGSFPYQKGDRAWAE